MRRVIVTGANGFIGSSLIAELIKKNIEVVAIGRSFLDNHLPDSHLIQKIEMNIENLDSNIEIIPQNEYDAFYHFAWQGVNGIKKANAEIQIENMRMTLACALASKKIGCKRFLCAGTIAEQAVYSLPNLKCTSSGMMYGVAKHCTHLMLESFCKSNGINYLWMQFSNIYGPNNTTGNLINYTVESLRTGKVATFGPAQQPYDFIYIDDLIEAIIRLGEIKTVNKMFFIGSGEPRILKDYLLEIGSQMERTELIKIGERPDDGIVYTMEMFDTSSIVAEIGEYNKMSFSEGIKRTIKNQ